MKIRKGFSNKTINYFIDSFGKILYNKSILNIEFTKNFRKISGAEKTNREGESR